MQSFGHYLHLQWMIKGARWFAPIQVNHIIVPLAIARSSRRVVYAYTLVPIVGHPTYNQVFRMVGAEIPEPSPFALRHVGFVPYNGRVGGRWRDKPTPDAANITTENGMAKG